MYIALSLLTVFILLCLLSKSLREQFKFLLLPALIISGICLGYYAITGQSPAQIPGDINAYFAQPQTHKEPSHKYYTDPEKHYGEQVE